MSDSSNTADPAAIQQDQELLAKYRKRLEILSGQQTHFVSVQTAPHILSEIRETQKALRSIKARLRAAGIPIADEPNDGPVEVPIAPMSAAPVPAFQVPYPRSMLFVGREHELERLAVLLDGDETIAVVPAIAGTGGIGKTMLAAEFAHRYRERFGGGVFWLTMEDPDRVASQVAACAGPGGLRLAGYEGWSFEDRIAAVKSAWQQPDRRLLIFDNLEDPALLHWRPTSGGCRVLITTRRTKWTARSGVRAISLRELARPDSLHLLLTPRYGSDLPNDPAADAICEALGDLPLALALAGAYLEHYPSVTLTAYATQITQNLVSDESLNAVLEEGLPTTHVSSIVTTFALSYQRLQTDNPIDALARTLFHRAAYCAPVTIPRVLLLVSIGMAEQEAAVYQRNVDAALHRLLTVGLLDDLGTAGVRLHRLLAAFARSLTPDPDLEQQWLTQALTALLYQINMVGSPQVGQPFLEHARHIATTTAYDITHACLLNNLGYLLRSLGDLAAARPYVERSLDIYEHILGSDHPDTASCLNNLGALFQDMGDLATARSYYQHALDIYERVVGSNHPDIATSLDNMGTLLQDMGEPVAALLHYQRALEIRENLQGPNHPDTALSLNNIGALLQKMGELAAALLHYQRALEIRENLQGPNHPDIATSLNNIGALLRDMGKLAAARPYIERALDISERVLGPDHPSTATSLNNLGSLLHDMGELAAARPYIERALDISERVLGPDHPDTVTSLNNVGGLLLEMDDLAAARSCLERVLNISERIRGTHHPDTARSLNNLGGLLQKMGELASARVYFERALNISERVQGPNHPLTNTIRNNLKVLDSTKGSPQTGL